MAAPLANNHISVDCVVLGFDGESLNVLLSKRSGCDSNGEVFMDYKLPGSLIYQDEDLDDAASRVLKELNGVSDVTLTQFKAFGSKDRTSNLRDVHWLEKEQAKVKRIVTIAYFSLVKLDKTLEKTVNTEVAEWQRLNQLGRLAFDHNLIIAEALKAIRREADNNRALIFDLLPKKFTASQFRMLMEIIYDKQLDVRNFHKKISQLSYIIPLDERQQGVAHRAARYYRFDKKAYSGSR
ncbi:NUDIX hydrolase [Duncaniella dubosii]|uniref:NUDIX hydrolase n=1 Tax=Duncaniella dubosii TaxID=2518971 RepID=UPI0032B201B7